MLSFGNRSHLSPVAMASGPLRLVHNETELRNALNDAAAASPITIEGFVVNPVSFTIMLVGVIVISAPVDIRLPLFGVNIVGAPGAVVVADGLDAVFRVEGQRHRIAGLYNPVAANLNTSFVKVVGTCDYCEILDCHVTGSTNLYSNPDSNTSRKWRLRGNTATSGRGKIVDLLATSLVSGNLGCDISLANNSSSNVIDANQALASGIVITGVNSLYNVISANAMGFTPVTTSGSGGSNSISGNTFASAINNHASDAVGLNT